VISSINRSRGWYGQIFTEIPKRSPIAHIILEARSGKAQSVTFRNPAYGKYPQWQAGDTLPASRDFDGLQVQIGKFEIKNEPGGIASLQIPISWSTTNNRLGTNWTLVNTELDDATGNHFDQLQPGNFITGRVAPGTFPGGFWPGENAWRLTLVFKRLADFSSNTIVTFKNVTIPPVGFTNFVPITNALAGIKVRISEFSRYGILPPPAASQPSFSGFAASVTVDLPEHPSDMDVGIVKMETAFGKPRRANGFLDMYAGPFVLLTFIPTNATTMDITVAVQKLRTVDFYVKPPIP